MSLKDLKRKYKTEIKSEKKRYTQARRDMKMRHREELEALYASGDIPRPNDPPKRAILEEIGNAVTHGVGSIFAIIAFILMLLSADTASEYVGAFIYSFGLFVMFTMSCMYHAFPHGTAVKRLFRRFDYSSIYLLIGATFAPPLLNVVGGNFGIIFFIIQWVIIAAGVSLVGVFGPTKLRFIHIPMYVILGWSALMLMPSLIATSFPLAMWILAGGIVYTLGIIPFTMKLKVSHFIWHFFVLAGAVVQWIGIYKYIYLG